LSYGSVCKNEDGPTSFSKSVEFPWLDEQLSPYQGQALYHVVIFSGSLEILQT
jgi:hypothetical protein